MSEAREDKTIKDQVRRAYTSFLEERAGCSCGETLLPARDPRGRLVDQLGYRSEEVASLPEGAAVSAFGCGNPHAFSDVRPGETVLDIGSGAGIDCFIAARRVGPTGRVIGVDMTEAMLARARANAAEAGLANVEFRQGDAEELPVADASVDWVISNCVINLAPDKPRVFREVARVLRPGGRVAISDIVLADDVGELPEVLRSNMELYAACVAGAVREGDYLAAMTAAGLTDVAVIERQVYADVQIDAFLDEARGRLGGGSRLQGLLADLQGVLSGKVWSARVVGRKPSNGGQPVNVEEPELVTPGTEDAAGIAGLLTNSGLPANHVVDSLDDFIVARDGRRVVGCVAVESYGEEALLRSLAVDPAGRGRGLARRLARAALGLARARGARSAVALTETIREWALRSGFTEVPRESLSEAVRSSWEFRERQCESATCMVLDL